MTALRRVVGVNDTLKQCQLAVSVKRLEGMRHWWLCILLQQAIYGSSSYTRYILEKQDGVRATTTSKRLSIMVSNCCNTAAWLNTRHQPAESDCLVVNMVVNGTETDNYQSLRRTNNFEIIESKLFMGFMTVFLTNILRLLKKIETQVYTIYTGIILVMISPAVKTFSQFQQKWHSLSCNDNNNDTHSLSGSTPNFFCFCSLILPLSNVEMGENTTSLAEVVFLCNIYVYITCFCSL